jgi:hypothetical protein
MTVQPTISADEFCRTLLNVPAARGEIIRSILDKLQASLEMWKKLIDAIEGFYSDFFEFCKKRGYSKETELRPGFKVEEIYRRYNETKELMYRRINYLILEIWSLLHRPFPNAVAEPAPAIECKPLAPLTRRGRPPKHKWADFIA